MELPDSLPANQNKIEVVDLLFRRGTLLKGKNLRKSSWREIAEFILRGNGQLQTAMWQRLLGAETRDDVLRVLRIIRKQSQRKGAARGSGARTWTAVTIKREQDATWQARLRRDEYWNYMDPGCSEWWWWDWWSDGGWRGLEEDFTAEGRFAYTAKQVLSAYERKPRLSFSSDVEATCVEDPSEDRFIEHHDPIEMRLSRHVQLASRRLGDAQFERAVFEAIGDSNNLEVVKAAVSVRQCQAAICAFSPFWIRSPLHWDGKTRFVDHLFVRTPVPEFLYGEWMEDVPRAKWLCWFILLAQNGSLHRAAKHFSWQIPRKLQRHLATAPADATPLEATMYAEVLRMGGTETDFNRLCHPAIAVDPTEPSDQPDWVRFWEETVRWFVSNHADIRDDQAAHLLDWAMHEYTEANAHRRAKFSWKGRTVRSAVLRSQEYHRLLSRPYANYRWDGHGWDIKFEHGRSAITSNVSMVWSFVELTTGEELFEEGGAQNHCVASYAARCVAGQCAIVSLRRDGKRCVTIEVCPATKTVLQARGRFNRECSSEERTVINKWLRETVRADDSSSDKLDRK